MKPSKKSLYVRKRHFGLSCLERGAITERLRRLKCIEKAMKIVEDDSDSDFELFYSAHRAISAEILAIGAVDPRINDALPVIERKHRLIDSFSDDEIRGLFRFESKEQLHRLLIGFQFPKTFQAAEGNIFSGEEILLCGLYRLHCVNVLGDDGWVAVFGMVESVASRACILFIDFLWNWWSYLLFDHMHYWLDKIPSMAEAIRLKMEEKNCPFLPGEFPFFAFIDNTMNATCRPGGGPARDGIHAPRNNPEIQRAWYNGWKKFHGLKWQTIDLPNGMNFKVDGPFSCRDNDITTLNSSAILLKLQVLLEMNQLHFYRIYGDSAYIVIDEGPLSARHQNPNPRQVLENKAMSSCREVIEWDYGDIGRYFKLLDYKHVLQIRKMPVARMCICAILLRNALVTMNGCNTSVYFCCTPPTFEEWTAEGMRAFDQRWITHVNINLI
jgi:hypothetical protein